MLIYVDRSMAGLTHRSRSCPAAAIAVKYAQVDSMDVSEKVALKILRKSKCSRCAEWAAAQ